MFALPVACYDTLEWLEKFRRKVNDRVRAEAMAGFLPPFRERYEQRLRLAPPDFDIRIGCGDELLRAVQTDGVALGALADDHRRRIRELATPILARMHAELDEIDKPRFADGQIRLDPEAHAPIFEAVSLGLADAGVLDAVSAYAGTPLVLNSLGLQVNTAKETRSKYGEFDAAGLPERATSYFHVDSNDWPSLKTLLYLSDVGPEQGPFRYVAGSHRLMGPFEAAVRKTNDKIRNTAVNLCALPPHFAQHANFGDYIDDKSPQALKLLRKELVVCDGRSDIVLFDNNGVHRGGMVRDGHRYLLQCMFVRARTAKDGKEARSLQTA